MRRALTVAALGTSAWLIWSARADAPTRAAEALEASPPTSEAGTLVLDLDDDASAGEIRDFADRYGLELTYTSEVSEDEALFRAEVTDLAAAIDAVSGDPLVEVAEQVMIIYAGTSGALDEIPASKVGEFEQQFLDYMRDTHPDCAQQIRDAKKDIPDEVKAILDEAAKTVAAQVA